MNQKSIMLMLTALFLLGSCGGGSNERTPMVTKSRNMTTSSSTKVTKDHDFQKKVSKVLVIGVFAEPDMKRIIENALVEQLKTAGPEAVAAHKILPVGEELTKELIQTQIEETQIDGVLITRLVGAQSVQTETIRTNSPEGPKASLDRAQGNSRDMFGHYSSVYQTVHAPGYAVDTPQVEVETRLFEVENATSVWQMNRTIDNPKTRADVISQLGQAIVESLRTEALI